MDSFSRKNNGDDLDLLFSNFSFHLFVSYLTSVFKQSLIGAAIDHEESPRTMPGVDVSMFAAGIIGLLTIPWEESCSISKNNVYGRTV